MLTANNGSELVAVGVDPLDGREASAGGPSSLARDVFDHDDGEHAWDEALEEMENVCHRSRRMARV